MTCEGNNHFFCSCERTTRHEMSIRCCRVNRKCVRQTAGNSGCQSNICGRRDVCTRCAEADVPSPPKQTWLPTQPRFPSRSRKLRLSRKRVVPEQSPPGTRESGLTDTFQQNSEKTREPSLLLALDPNTAHKNAFVVARRVEFHRSTPTHCPWFGCGYGSSLVLATKIQTWAVMGNLENGFRRNWCLVKGKRST